MSWKNYTKIYKKFISDKYNPSAFQAKKQIIHTNNVIRKSHTLALTQLVLFGVNISWIVLEGHCNGLVM